MTEALAEPGVSIRLPDGSERHYAQPVGGADVAASISKSLSKAAIAVKIDGALRDLTTPVPNGATVEIVSY